MGIKTSTNSVVGSNFLDTNRTIINTSEYFNNHIQELQECNFNNSFTEDFSFDEFFVVNDNKRFSDGVKDIFGIDEQNGGFIHVLSSNVSTEYVVTDLNQLDLLRELYSKCYNTPLDLLNYEVGDAFKVIYRDGTAPTLVFDNIYLDNNLNKNMKEVIEHYPTGKEGFIQDYTNLLKIRLNNVQTDRERAVVTALFFALDFPKMDYNLGGCHDLGSEDAFLPENIISELVEDNEFDCSSLLTCCLKSGGFKISDITRDKRTSVNSWDIEAMNSFRLDSGLGRPGDAVYFEGSSHVGIIVGTNQRKNELAIVHSSASGDGVSILIVDSNTGKVKNNYGTESDDKLKVGNQYFTHIVPIEYSDDYNEFRI